MNNTPELTQQSANGIPLWPLPLLAGLLPALATLIALQLSIRLDLIPACNPFFEGCVSVSRAARYGLPNTVFRAVVLPAAALQGLTWLLCRIWLVALGAPRERWLRHLAWIGMTAAIFLVVYGAFLGTEGHAYRLLRHYGTVVYFGFTCLSMLIAGDATYRIARHRPALARTRLDLALLALTAALLFIGLIGLFVGLLFDAEAKDRIENVAEWWGAAILSSVFLVLAWLWQRSNFRARFGVEQRRAA